MNPNLSSLIRHGLTAAGGFLVAKGLASSDQVIELAGAVSAIIGLVWSMTKGRKATTPPAA